jgi:hypothetical protein
MGTALIKCAGEFSISRSTLSNPIYPDIPINPDDLTGLIVWLNAELGVTTDGDDVTAWADQSGNSNNPSLDLYGTGNPQYKPSEINGHACVYFNNTKCFVGEGINLSEWTVIHASKLYYDEDGIGRIFCNTRIFGDNQNILVGSWQNYSNRMFAEGWTYQGTSQDYVWKINTGTCSTADQQSSFYQNGALLGSHAFSAPLNDYGIGGMWVQDNPERSISDIAEVIIYNRVLTTQERQGVESYLNLKYAIY